MLQGCFKYVPGRKFPGGYSRRDRLDRRTIKKYVKSVAAETKLYVADTFK